jgi:hypothetical protein
MGTNTPNLNLFKPAPADLVDVTTDISANYDLIDTAVAAKETPAGATAKVAAHAASTTAHSGTYVPLVGNPNAGTPKLYLGPALPNTGPLTQLIVKDDNTPVTGRPELATFEFKHDGSDSYIFHLTQGPNMGSALGTGASLIGMGIDYAGTGLFVNNKATGIGIKITQNPTISSATAYGMLVNCGEGAAPGVWMQQNPGAGSNAQPACVFFAYASANVAQRLVEFRKPSISTPSTGDLIGYVASGTGQLVWQSQLYTQPLDVNTVPMQVTGLAGQAVDLQRWDVSGTGTVALVDKNGAVQAQSMLAQGASAALSFYDTAGTANQRRFQMSQNTSTFLLTARNDAGANLRQLLAISHTAGDITPLDGANLILGTTTGMKVGTATTQKLGFFNATPIVQPAGTTDLRAALINLGLYATGGATPLDLNGGALTTGAITANGVTSTNTIQGTALVAQGASTSMILYDTSATSGQRQFKWTTTAGLLVLSARNDDGTSAGDRLYIKHTTGDITPKDGANLILGTTTGTKIGSATTQKIGFYNATPVVQPSGTPAAASDLASVISLANSLRTNLLALGLVA